MTTTTPFRKILIANRGEIALRIIRTARAMGYRTVAVFSSADENARPARETDQAVHIGEARLQWHQDVDRYAMQFDARLARGLPLIEQRSAGRLDDHGLAPERFTDRRRGRSTLAANFQRDTGRITFSGPRVEYPAWPGAQDRLGWIVQLAAIFSAAREPLNDVSIFVVGARGGAGLWTFRLQGVETVQTALGPVEALYLRREPERAEDQRVEAWLDPARGHWPVRLRSTPIRGGEPLELLLAAEPTRP